MPCQDGDVPPLRLIMHEHHRVPALILDGSAPDLHAPILDAQLERLDSDRLLGLSVDVHPVAHRRLRTGSIHRFRSNRNFASTSAQSAGEAVPRSLAMSE